MQISDGSGADHHGGEFGVIDGMVWSEGAATVAKDNVLIKCVDGGVQSPELIDVHKGEWLCNMVT